jgi:hypothetical protein
VRANLGLSDGQVALRAEGGLEGREAIVDEPCSRFGCPFCHRGRDGVEKLAKVLRDNDDRAFSIVLGLREAAGPSSVVPRLAYFLRLLKRWRGSKEFARLTGGRSGQWACSVDIEYRSTSFNYWHAHVAVVVEDDDAWSDCVELWERLGEGRGGVKGFIGRRMVDDPDRIASYIMRAPCTTTRNDPVSPLVGMPEDELRSLVRLWIRGWNGRGTQSSPRPPHLFWSQRVSEEKKRRCACGEAMKRIKGRAGEKDKLVCAKGHVTAVGERTPRRTHRDAAHVLADSVRRAMPVVRDRDRNIRNDVVVRVGNSVLDIRPGRERLRPQTFHERVRAWQQRVVDGVVLGD